MTISSTTSKNQYPGNGSNTVFVYTFKIFDEDNIAVLIGDTVQTITTHYTVSGVGNDAGGNITFVTAPANGTTVTLKRAEPLLQSIDYTENDDFPSAAHEEGLDRSVIRDQFLQEQINRAVKVSEGSTVSNLTFPDPTGDAAKFLRVNATEDGYEHYNISGTGDLAVSSYIETLLDDTTAAAARTTLGLGSAALENLASSTWTPAITFDTAGDLSVAYSNQTGVYTKIGELVIASFAIITSTFTHTTASGKIRVTGLPFTPNTGTIPGSVLYSGFTSAGYETIIPLTTTSQSYLIFNKCGSGVAQTNASAADFPTGGTVVLVGQITYTTG